MAVPPHFSPLPSARAASFLLLEQLTRLDLNLADAQRISDRATVDAEIAVDLA
jgi:hypothetical protein